MSTTYRTIAGDTFESISRKKYGTAEFAGLIAKANPGTVEPLSAGWVLAIPTRPFAPADKLTQAPASDPNEVAILINNVRFRFWSDLRLTRSLDAMDTLEFSAPFDPNAPGYRDTFRPFSYSPLVVTVGGSPLFTGTLVGVTPRLGDGEKTISVAGYSKPGVLGDCTAPASAYPLEFNEQALPDIAKSLVAPFGLSVLFDDEGGATFERVALEPGETVLDFLADLARQRNLVVSSTNAGVLLFQRSVDPGAPSASLRQGESPVISVSPSFSPQQYYSHITGLEPVLVGTEGSQHTVKNPHLTGVLRPLTFKSGDVQGGDLQQAVTAKAGRMYGNMAAYEVQVNTWRDPSGSLWTPNTTIKLEAAGAMVYTSYEFVVRSVAFERNSDREVATLDLVLPGSFSGELPEVLPWD